MWIRTLLLAYRPTFSATLRFLGHEISHVLRRGIRDLNQIDGDFGHGNCKKGRNLSICSAISMVSGS